MAQPVEHVTVDPDQCGGRPCIRGMRIRVSEILDLFAIGLTPDQILGQLPDLRRDDIRAALKLARRSLER